MPRSTAVSSHWRGTPAQGEVFINSAEQTYSALQQQVRVVASPQVTLTSKSGRVPVTLENNLGCGGGRLTGADVS